MTLPLQLYVDKQGPAVSAAWLNEVDQKRAVMNQPAGSGGSILGLGLCKQKASNTSRNVNTMTADPDLQFSVEANANFYFKAFLVLSATTTTTQGFQFNISSTAGTGVGYIVGSGITNNAPNPYFFLQGAGLGPIQFSNINTAITDFLIIEAAVSSVAAGTIALSWSCRTGGGNNTNLLSQSFAILTRLS